MNDCDISLYAIIDPNRVNGRSMVDLARAAAQGGATIFQYRDKTSDTRTLIENARALKAALAPFDVPLLMNDRVDVALAAELDGVHIGQSDMPAVDARRLLGGDKIIGLTLKSPQQALAAPTDVIDYACAGGVYATLSKDNPSDIGIAGWQSIANSFRSKTAHLPIGAIAGIDASNLAEVLVAGADGAAIISAIFMQDDVERATRELAKIIERHRP